MNKTKIGFSLLGIALIGGGIGLSTSLTSCNNVIKIPLLFPLDLCDLKAGDNILSPFSLYINSSVAFGGGWIGYNDKASDIFLFYSNAWITNSYVLDADCYSDVKIVQRSPSGADEDNISIYNLLFLAESGLRGWATIS